MTTFKIREKKRGRYQSIKTLDAKHKEQVNYFKSLEQSLPDIKTELIMLENNIKLIENDPEKFAETINIKDKIFELEKVIKAIENKTEEKEYYLNNGELLYQYYDTKNKVVKRSSKISKSNHGNKTIVDFFSKKGGSSSSEIKTCKQLSKRNRIKTLSVAGIYNEYLSHIDNSYVKSYEDTDVNICIHCNYKLKLYLSEGLMICEECGYEEQILVDSDKPSYKEPPKEIQFFSYKRINHFNEYITQATIIINEYVIILIQNKSLKQLLVTVGYLRLAVWFWGKIVEIPC